MGAVEGLQRDESEDADIERNADRQRRREIGGVGLEAADHRHHGAHRHDENGDQHRMVGGERDGDEGDGGEADPDFRRGAPDLQPLALLHASPRFGRRAARTIADPRRAGPRHAARCHGLLASLRGEWRCRQAAGRASASQPLLNDPLPRFEGGEGVGPVARSRSRGAVRGIQLAMISGPVLPSPGNASAALRRRPSPASKR